MARAAKASWSLVSELAMALPDVAAGTSYGTPAFLVRGKMFVRLKEDGATAVVYVPMVDRDFLLQQHPGTFFITDHYRDYPAMLINLASVTRALLVERLIESWRQRAPKRLVLAHPDL